MSIFNRVVFIGNSITYHPPKEDIGWSGNWGMAASSEENDYVHILMRYILKVYEGASFMVTNDEGFEQQYWDFDFKKLKKVRNFGATLIILCIGDNVIESEVESKNFGHYYLKLLNYINAEGKAQVVCGSCFWPKTNNDRIIKEVAANNGCLLADIGQISQDEKNMAKSQFWHEGVGWHPSDQGMNEIARIIQSKLA